MVELQDPLVLDALQDLNLLHQPLLLLLVDPLDLLSTRNRRAFHPPMLRGHTGVCGGGYAEAGCPSSVPPSPPALPVPSRSLPRLAHLDEYLVPGHLRPSLIVVAFVHHLVRPCSPTAAQQLSAQTPSRCGVRGPAALTMGPTHTRTHLGPAGSCTGRICPQSVRRPPAGINGPRRPQGARVC